MDCIAARELVSAQIDGDAGQSDQLDAHLEICAACSAWKENAHGMARRLMRPAAQPGPSRGYVAPKPKGFAGYRVIRLVLAWIGVLLIGWNIPDLFAGGVDVTLIHLTRHQSSFSMALGATFLFVAWRPDRAYGMVPVAAVFAIALAGATVDLVIGASSLERESIHLVEILGLVLVWVLGISAGPGRRRQRTERPSSIDDDS
jgi:predicted anti-sigma-YlaC factor YlaD